MNSPVPQLSLEATRAPLPGSTDVLVIGGGIAGTALAYYLAGNGVDVVVVERGELNREASGTNAGSFHLQLAIHQLSGQGSAADRDRLLAEARLSLEAFDLWRGLAKELEVGWSPRPTMSCASCTRSTSSNSWPVSRPR
jgi:glycine/D-amino acid oxidase-like deaminating enzyme